MCNEKIDSGNKHSHNGKLQNLLVKTAIKLFIQIKTVLFKQKFTVIIFNIHNLKQEWSKTLVLIQ